MTQKLSTLVPPQLHGVTYVTGHFGVGKSTFAAQFDNPASVAFLDFDGGKSRNLNDMLHFGAWFPVLELAAAKKGANYTDQDLFNVFTEILNGMPAGRFNTAILDNIGPMEAAFAAEVKRSPATYGCNPANVSAGRYGGANPGVKFLISRVIAALNAKGITTIVVTAHVGAVWINGVPVLNKFNAKGSEAWQQAALMTLALVPGNGVAPAGIVIKEAFGQMEFDAEKGDFTPKRVLPTKLPVATPAAIREYIANPISDRPALPEEIATEEEKAEWLSNKFTNAQLAYVQTGMDLVSKGLVGDDGVAVVAAPETIGKKPTVGMNDWTKLYAYADKKGEKAKAVKMKDDKKTFIEIASAIGMTVSDG